MLQVGLEEEVMAFLEQDWYERRRKEVGVGYRQWHGHE